ncbi:MAG: CARDB domain-containing protein [Vicinamibacterales bacterium]
MRQRLFVVAALIVLVSITDIRAQRPASSATRAGAPTSVITFDRFDRSPRLRDLPPGPPPVGEMVKEREPRWRRVSRHPSGLLSDPMVQASPEIPMIPGPSRSVEGINNVNGVLPPDTNGDVGPNHFVQWVNTSFAVYSKGNATTPPALLYGPATANTLWAGFGGPCETRNDGDPIVRYDHLADRWVMSQLAIPNNFLGILLFGPFYECIAVSATPDPLGAYYRYQYSFDKLNDYPKLAVWPDGYYMTMNQYTALSLQWAGQGVVAFDRAKMLAGQPASAIYYDLAAVDTNLAAMLAADLDGPAPPAGSPAYFAQVDDDAWDAVPSDQIQIWQFHTDWTAPSQSSFTRVAALPTAPFDSDMCGNSRNCLPQPGTTATIDAMSDRLMYRLQYRNFGDHESLVVNHTVDADGTDHAGVRWYEIRNPGSSPSIYQQGTYAPDSNHRWMGSIAMDSSGNMALGFSVTGVSTFPSIRYTGRLAGDPPNVMTLGETDLIVGTGSQTSSLGRWGDYSSMVVDPVDDCTFWYTQEYYAVTSEAGWQTRIGSFSLPNCGSSTPPSNLPAVSVAASPSTATEAGPVAGAFTFARTGDTTEALTVHYAVGGTATPGSDYDALSGIVTINPGSATAVVPVMPIDDLAVESNESVIVSVATDPMYVIGSAGAVVTIVSNDSPSDLVVTVLTGPSTAGAGSPITVNDTTKNQGAGPSGASVTAFYLSTNTVIDASDISLGTRNVGALPPGMTDSSASTFTVPDTAPVGNYYLLAKADSALTVAESNENNNLKAGSIIPVGPDLVVSVLTVPSTAVAGGSMAVSDTTKNQGGGSAAASATSFYLSANVVLDAGDTPLGNRSVGALVSGLSETVSTSLAIPPNTAAGTYYIIAKADGSGVVTETQETNNVRFSTAFKIGPDLVVSSAAIPTVAGAGFPLTVNDAVKNQGTSLAGPSTTSFYLSANVQLDSTDKFLGSRSVPALSAGGTSAGTTTVMIPADVQLGQYFILVSADDTNAIQESAETNNVSYGVTRVGPDLTVLSLTAPTSAVAGATISVTDTVKNVGGGSAGASTTRLYLSSNFTFDASDQEIGSRAATALGPSATNAGSASVTIPTGTVAGLYYIIAVTDADNAVPETGETNNTRALAIRIN